MLRGPELHRGLGLMRPPRYFFSTPRDARDHHAIKINFISIAKNIAFSKRYRELLIKNTPQDAGYF